MDEPLKNAYIRETIDRRRTLAKFYKFITWIILLGLLVLIYYISNIYVTLFYILFVIIYFKTRFFKPFKDLKIFDVYNPILDPVHWVCPNCKGFMNLGGSWKCDKCFFVNTTENNNNRYPMIYDHCYNCFKLQQTAFCEYCHKEFLI